jgi:hypothetical protein
LRGSLKEGAMELHYHPRLFAKQKKDFKEYFLEFLMIFFAVTLGFLAENLRENISNGEIEKKYIRSLQEDLRRDTLQINSYILFRTNLLRYCDSLQYCIADTNVFKNSNNMYNYCRELARYMRYFPTDRTIQQLKNAGHMHVIKNWDVSNAIVEYDNETKKMLEADYEMNEEILKYRRHLIDLLDLSDYDKKNPHGSFMESQFTNGNPGFISTDISKFKALYNEVFTVSAFTASGRQSAISLKDNATKLLHLLQETYE